MSKLLKKMDDGRELRGSELKDVEVKVTGENEIVIIGSTAAPDRDNEVLDPKGWDLKNFRKNPVVLAAHNYWAPAIGKAKVKQKDGILEFKIEFPEEGVNPTADIYRKLYKGGFMSASSVGFIPTEWINGKRDSEPRRTFLKQELLEISLVTVPANPEALVTEKSFYKKAVEKEIITEDELATVHKSLDDMFEKSQEQDNEARIKELEEKDEARLEEVEDLKSKIAELEAAIKRQDKVILESIDKVLEQIGDDKDNISKVTISTRLSNLEKAIPKHYSEIVMGGGEHGKKPKTPNHTPTGDEIAKAVSDGINQA